MAGDVQRRYAQFAVHSDPTVLTATVATRRIAYSNIVAKPNIVYHKPKVFTGNFEPNKVVVQQRKWVDFEIEFPFQPEDFAMFQGGIFGAPAVTTVDTTGKTRTSLSTNVAAKDVYTCEFYDGDQLWIVNGIAFKTFTLTWSDTGEIMAKLTGYGQKKVTGSAASLTQVIAAPYESWQKLLFVSASGSAPTDALDSTLTGGEFSIDNGCTPNFVGDNQQFIGSYNYGDFDPKCTLNLMMSSAALQYSNYNAGTDLSVGIEFRGPIISAAYRGAKISLAGPWEEWDHDQFGEANALKLAWVSQYNATLAYGFKFTTTNLVTSY